MVALFYTAEEDVLLTPAVQDLVRLLDVGCSEKTICIYEV